MTIKDMELQTGLARANIRYYEAEGLITPRRAENGYRDYSQADADTLLRIKLLRALGLTIEQLKTLAGGEAALDAVLAERLQAMQQEQHALGRAEQVAEQLRQAKVDYQTLDAERYLAELDAFCKEQERVQREKQKEFKANNPELFCRYPKFSKALAKVLDPSDEIKPAATEEQIGNQESKLDFTFPSQVREFFLLTAGIQVSTGVILTLSGMFDLTIHGEKYCVLGEFWKEADGDQLLLRTGEETVWYYAHEQDKVKRLCNDLIELLEKKLANYLNQR